MPLTLNVGLQKKVGQPDYGSLGASCHLEVEIEHSLIREPEQLREKIKYLFNQAKQAVEEELNAGAQHDAIGHGNSGKGSQRSNGRQATASQVRAIHAIADRNRIELTARLRDRFGVEKPDELLIGQASELIDELKNASNGAGGRR